MRPSGLAPLALAIALAAAFTFESDAAILAYTAHREGDTTILFDSFDINAFDPRFGTLQTVTVALAATSTGGSNMLENEDTVAGQAILTIGTTVSINGPAGVTLEAAPKEQRDSGIQGVAADDPAEVPDPDWAGEDCFAITGSASQDTDAVTLTGPAGGGTDDLTAYQALTPLTFTWQSVVNAGAIATVSNMGRNNAPHFAFDATVTYAYASSGYIPEPASIALMGLAGLFLIRRRR